MRHRFVIVSGLPASGKSTLGRAIASALNLSFLDKDEILEGLFDRVGVGDSVWRTKLSRTADEVLCREAHALPGAVVTSWWRHRESKSESGTPTDWLSSLPGDLVELYCACSPYTAANRFFGRNRHAGHLDGRYTHADLLEQFRQQSSLGPLAVGRLVRVDTEAPPQIADVLTELLRQSGQLPCDVFTAA